MAKEISTLLDETVAAAARLEQELDRVEDGGERIQIHRHFTVLHRRCRWYRARLHMRRPAWVRARLSAQANAMIESNRRAAIIAGIQPLFELRPLLAWRGFTPPPNRMDG
jgi:hypothetical protein